MLILTRKTGDKIFIGHHKIQLDILDFDKHNDIIRLGFTAPKSISIDRAERRINNKKLTTHLRINHD